MKFGQLMNVTCETFFCEKSYTKCGGPTSPRLKLSITLDQ